MDEVHFVCDFCGKSANSWQKVEHEANCPNEEFPKWLISILESYLTKFKYEELHNFTCPHCEREFMIPPGLVLMERE